MNNCGEMEDIMKIHDIMTPWEGKKKIKGGINENCNVHDLTEDVTKGKDPFIQVVNGNRYKVGDIEKALLQYLIESSDMWVLDSIIDNFNEAVIVVDVKGKIFYANNAYTNILGVPVYKIIGRQIQQVEPGSQLQNVLDTKIPFIKERQYIKTLDKYVSVNIFLIEKDGELKAVASIFSDSTEVVKLGHEVEKANEIALSYRRQVEIKERLTKLNIIGKSPNFLNVVSQALIVADTDVPVFIRGESGVGKEIMARLIHSNSIRKDKPMITVNCAAIPESLIESELFGYEGGSFTGAKSCGKMGKFELANGGTLFLDEIGDMSLEMQSKLLRVLQDGEIEKIGRQRNIPVDVRLITATNQPIEKMIKERKFREDLYFRLNIVETQVPPLRNRIEDIGILANHFLKKYIKKYGNNIFFSKEMLSFLHSYKWPGNVRELQNCVEYAVIMCQGEIFGSDYLPPYMKNELSGMIVKNVDKETRPEYNNKGLKEAVKDFEKRMIIEAITASGGNRSKAMKLLGLSRRTFYRKLKDYKIINSANK